MKKKILIVEDEPSMRKALSEKFTLEGFDVSVAINGIEGLEKSLAEHPNLILLDIVMPKMDGMTMLEKLRENDDWGKQVPAIILTNLVSDDEKRMNQVTELLPTYYLEKTDWKIAEIVDKVKSRLEI